MKPRTTPLTLPDPLPARYWQVMGYTFRNPYYGIGNQIVACMGRHARDPATDTRPLDDQALSLIPLAGLVVGACWADPLRELTTPALGLGTFTDEALLAYGERVAEELQDADLDVMQLLDLFGLVTPDLHKRQSLLMMAMERSAFSEAPQAGSTAS